MEPAYRKILKEELAQRCERNPRYSVRSFAKSLSLDAGALSRILSGKQIPSLNVSNKILEALSLEPRMANQFLESVANVHSARPLQRRNSFTRQKFPEDPAKDLSIDLYRVIADWYHIAIMELTYVDEFTSSPKWIAGQLGISETEAKLAIERLLDLELLKIENGKLIKTETQLSTTDKHLTTPALRKNQKQLLEKSIISLEEDPIEQRSVTSMTMAIDPDRLPEAKRMIRDFNRKLCDFLENGKRKRVYNLGIALVPLSKEKV